MYIGNKGLKIILAALVIVSLITIACLVWFIFRLIAHNTTIKNEKDEMKMNMRELRDKYDMKELMYYSTLANLYVLYN